MLISFIYLFVFCSPFSGSREVFSAIQLSETSVLCSYCLYGSAVFGVFPLYVFFLKGRAILKRLFASDQSTICIWRQGLVYRGGSSLLGSSFSLTSLWSHRRQTVMHRCLFVCLFFICFSFLFFFFLLLPLFSFIFFFFLIFL